MKADTPFMLGVVALMVAIVAIGAALIVGEIRDSDRCRASGGRQVVTGVVIIHSVPVDQFRCEH